MFPHFFWGAGALCWDLSGGAKGGLAVAWMYRSGQTWIRSNAAYKRQFVTDAGAVPMGAAGADVTISTAADLLAALNGVDVLIDETYSSSLYTWDKFLEDYQLQGVATLPKVVQERKVFRLDGLVSGTGSSDWFAGAVAEADEVLRDVIGAVQGTLGTRGTWLRRLYDGVPAVETSGSCSNALAPAVLRDGTIALPAMANGVSLDFFPAKVSVLYAQQFTITYAGTYKTLENKNSNGNEKYLLYQRGTQPPADTSGYKVFAVPLQGVAVEDTSVLRFLELLGVQATVRYMQTQYATSGCLQSLAQRSAIGPLASSSSAAVRQAQLAAVDALFTWSGSAEPKSIAMSATADPGSLQRAEWIKFVAAFFNKEAEAQRIFEAVRQQYLFEAQATLGVATRPVVARPRFGWAASCFHNLLHACYVLAVVRRLKVFTHLRCLLLFLLDS